MRDDRTVDRLQRNHGEYDLCQRPRGNIDISRPAPGQGLVTKSGSPKAGPVRTGDIDMFRVES